VTFLDFRLSHVRVSTSQWLALFLVKYSRKLY